MIAFFQLFSLSLKAELSQYEAISMLNHYLANIEYPREKIYLKENAFTVTERGLFLIINDVPVPIRGINFDEFGFYIEPKEAFFNTWTCKNCGYINSDDWNTCSNCNKYRGY